MLFSFSTYTVAISRLMVVSHVAKENRINVCNHKNATTVRNITTELVKTLTETRYFTNIP